MKKSRFLLVISVLMLLFCLAACGKKSGTVTYEVIDGQIVEIKPDEATPKPTKEPKQSKNNEEKSSSKKKKTESSTDEGTAVIDNEVSDAELQNVNPGEEAYDGSDEFEGTAVTIVEGAQEYNTIAAESSVRISTLEKNLETAVKACSDIYKEADKGEGINVTLSSSTVYQLIAAVGNAGFPAVDSNNDFNMQCYGQLDDFGKSISSSGDISGTYFVVYSDGHISGYQLYREGDSWHLLAMSSQLEEFKVYQDSKGRYTVDEIKYTDKGWLIYKRNTDTKYNMIRVLPQDDTAKQLCARYIEPVGYLENNLFTKSWTQDNMGPIDFNSLYAYLFGMYNGTQMLSSYNVRTYYKAYGGTKIYIVPTETFETVVTTYFDIDTTVLKNISDYSYSLGGYMFLGYNRDYYNVTPKTPTPEVVDYTYNSDGSITMTVDAVNDWYGTDRAFRHILTVYPGTNGFKYLSNELLEDENNIIPEQKLSEMLDVERSKSVY